MVDDLNGNATAFGFGEGARGSAAKGFPGVFVDFSPQGSFECLIRVRAGAGEVSLTHKEALFVVIRIHKPAGDAVRIVGADLAGIGIEYVHAVDLDLDVARFPAVGVGFLKNGNIRLYEDHKQIAFAVSLQLFAHVQVRVHACLEHGNPAELAKLGGGRLVVEGAGYEQVESGIGHFT